MEAKEVKRAMSAAYEVPFLIIGGGIGGLATALAVAKNGQSVCVIEQAAEFSEIGAGLQLGPNAIAMLDKFGLLDAISEYAVYPQRLVIKDAMSGQELTALNLGAAFRERFGYPYVVMHRSDLHKVLLDACQKQPSIKLETNRTVVSAENLGDQAKVTCRDGSVYLAKAVIGADGLWSKTRKLLVDDEPICSEYVAYRGTIPISEISTHAGLDDVIAWIGPELHLVQYPVRRKELYNQVVVFRSHHYSKEVENTDTWGTTEEMDERFQGCCPAVRNAVSYIQRHRRWPLYDRNPIDSWTTGRITLLGDAAHPMLQYLAQGACQAMEDAVCLGEKLRNHGADIEHAFSEYQQERIARTSKVQRNARKFGDMLHTKDDLTILLRNKLFSQRRDDDFQVVDWLYGQHVLANR